MVSRLSLLFSFYIPLFLIYNDDSSYETLASNNYHVCVELWMISIGSNDKSVEIYVTHSTCPI